MSYFCTCWCWSRALPSLKSHRRKLSFSSKWSNLSSEMQPNSSLTSRVGVEQVFIYPTTAITSISALQDGNTKWEGLLIWGDALTGALMWVEYLNKKMGIFRRTYILENKLFFFWKRQKKDPSIYIYIYLLFQTKGAAIVAKGHFQGTNYQLPDCWVWLDD